LWFHSDRSEGTSSVLSFAEVLLDLSPPVREMIEDRFVDAGEVGDAVLDRCPFETEPCRQFVA
jgi:hypothetical protein